MTFREYTVGRDMAVRLATVNQKLGAAMQGIKPARVNTPSNSLIQQPQSTQPISTSLKKAAGSIGNYFTK